MLFYRQIFYNPASIKNLRYFGPIFELCSEENEQKIIPIPIFH